MQNSDAACFNIIGLLLGPWLLFVGKGCYFITVQRNTLETWKEPTPGHFMVNIAKAPSSRADVRNVGP